MIIWSLLNSLLKYVNNMYLEEIAAFASVVQEGSFSAAAKRLGRSKALVSQQVTRLEKHLGVQLLFRTTRRMELTEAGRACLPECQTVLRAQDEVERAAAQQKGEMVGEIRLTVPVSLGETFLEDIVFAFAADHPHIRVQLDLENRQLDLIGEGYDLAVRATHNPQDDLVALRAGDLIEVMCASPSYLLQHGSIMKPDDLSDHMVIANRYQQNQPVWSLLAPCGEVLNVPVQSNVVLNHYPMVKSGVLKGAGIARLPHYLVVDELRTGRLVRLLPEYRLGTTPIYVIYPYHGALPLRTRRMVEFLRSRLESQLNRASQVLEGLPAEVM